VKASYFPSYAFHSEFISSNRAINEKPLDHRTEQAAWTLSFASHDLKYSGAVKSSEPFHREFCCILVNSMAELETNFDDKR
jgi:hypothetical protein